MLINCSPAFVMKLSRIHGLARLGRIYSILAPYRCPRCASDALVVLKTEELAGLSRPIAAPECRCKECEGTDGLTRLRVLFRLPKPTRCVHDSTQPSAETVKWSLPAQHARPGRQKSSPARPRWRAG